jgi:hypothetical protein
MTSKALLVYAAIFEALAGLSLILVPVLFVQLLLGGSLSAAGIGTARVGGFGLLSLAVACWPTVESRLVQLRAMLIYNLLAAFYLGSLLWKYGTTGKLLLAAFFLHTFMALLLLRAWFRRYNEESKS